MSDAIYFEYDREKLEAAAHRRGFASVQAYLADLVEFDLVDEPIDVADDLREALREMKAGEGRTDNDWWDEDDETER